jgi:glycosyltransferase involved in cell wall biosynthesis
MAGVNKAYSRNSVRQPHLAIIVTSALSVVWFRGQIRMLRKVGFRVTFIASPGTLLRQAEAEGAELITVPMERGISPFRDLVTLWRLWRILCRIRPDIINVGTPKAGLLGGLAARLAFLPRRVYTIHGLRFETATGYKHILLKLMERVACYNAHYVRCVSPSVRQKAIQVRVLQPKKAYVVGAGSANGVDCGHFQAADRRSHELRLALGIPPSALVVGFVGRFTQDKGIKELFYAYRRLSRDLPDLHLLLVGCFEELDPVGSCIREELESDKNVHFAGLVSDTAPYYQMMDVLALPTYREGLPVVSVEAQASGVPVVTTTATGAVDSVVDGITGKLVPVRDEEALAAALKELLTDQDKRLHMGKAASQWVKQQFRRDLIWDALLKDYRNILQQKCPGPLNLRRRITSLFERVKSIYRAARHFSLPESDEPI